MKLVVTQCSVGRYNLVGNNETLEFTMVIKNDDGKVVEEGKNTARISFSGEPDRLYDFKDQEDVGYLFAECFEYANRIISSTDYYGNCILFAKTYREHFEELSKGEMERTLEKAKKDETELLAKLKRVRDCIENGGWPLDDYSPSFSEPILGRIAMFQKWIDGNNEKIALYKDGVPEIEKLRQQNAKWQESIDKMRELAGSILSDSSQPTTDQ